MIPAMPPILVSYHYAKNHNTFVTKIIRAHADAGHSPVMIDSGAFSAFKIGAKIDIDAYIDFCKGFDGHPNVWGCVMLDVIGDWDASRRNLDYMLEAGVTPMPVLTIDCPLSVLDELKQVNKRICIAGGSMDFPGSKAAMCRRYRQAANDHPDCEFHGLAFVKVPEMYQVGLASVDSSSFCSGKRYATMQRFDWHTGTIKGHSYPNARAKITKIPDLWKYVTDCRVPKAHWQNKTESIKSVGFFSFSAAFAHVCQSLYARRHGVRYFLAINSAMPSYYWILCSAMNASDDFRSFDYPKALADLLRLKSYSKDDRVKATADAAAEAAARYDHAHKRREA